MNRIYKQILYGLFFLIIILVIGGGVFYFFKSTPSCADNKKNQNEEAVDCGGPPIGGCAPCALKNKQPLKASSPEIFDNGNGTITILAEINNPNPQVGADKFSYTINLFNKSGENIFSKTSASFIYPEKNRTVIEAEINLKPKEVDKGEIIIGEVSWQSADKFADIPEKNISVRSSSLQKINKELVFKGNVLNNNSFKLDQLIIKVVLISVDGFKENASYTTLENLDAYLSRDFAVHIPINSESVARVDPAKTKVIVEIVR